MRATLAAILLLFTVPAQAKWDPCDRFRKDDYSAGLHSFVTPIVGALKREARGMADPETSYELAMQIMNVWHNSPSAARVALCQQNIDPQQFRASFITWRQERLNGAARRPSPPIDFSAPRTSGVTHCTRIAGDLYCNQLD